MDEEKQITNALELLGLGPNFNHNDKKVIDQAYKKKALKLHPDKGGTHEQFLALSEAYQFILTWFQCQENVDNYIQKSSKKKVDITPSIADALTHLYITISIVEKKLTDAKIHNIPQKQLKATLEHIALTLRSNILDKSPSDAAELLRQHANALNDSIINIYSGPSPALAGLVASVMAGICTLLIALSAGITISGGLIVMPLVGAVALGGFCFFTAVDAKKQKTRLQNEMRTIVTAINKLADVILQEVNNVSELILPIEPMSQG